METIRTKVSHDTFLAAITVIPAAILWVFTEHFYLAIALGVTIFLGAEYGYPAYKSGRLTLAPVLRLAASVRENIQSRYARRV